MEIFMFSQKSEEPFSSLLLHITKRLHATQARNPFYGNWGQCDRWQSTKFHHEPLERDNKYCDNMVALNCWLANSNNTKKTKLNVEEIMGAVENANQ